MSNSNPLLSKKLLPEFSKIKPQHIKPAVLQVLKQNRTAIKKLLSENKNFTWENLIYPLEEIDDRLACVWSVVTHLNAITSTPQIRKAYDAVLPAIIKYSAEMGQNNDMYKAVESVYASQNFKQLDEAQQKIIRDSLRDFRLNGVSLVDSKKKQFAKLQTELGKLSTDFANHVLDSTFAWQYLANEKETAGIPEISLNKALNDAKNKKQNGWLFNLDMPSYQAVITYADSRKLRQKFYTAYVTRASKIGDHAKKWDNSKIIDKILYIRHQLALLIGFKNYAELSLATKMVHEPKKVLDFLNNLNKCARKYAKCELSELKQFARKKYGITKLQPWDVAYCSEKLRQFKFDISEEELREYFPVDHVLQGMFAIVHKLFGISIKEVKAFEAWHKDVRMFAIYSAKKEIIGYFYADLYARNDKRNGAWMDECRVRRRLSDGSIRLPVAYLNCNFSAPQNDTQALLTHHEVVTLFHEFGHCLHQLLAKVDYAASASINNVPYDAVEFPSQFLECWCWEKESLKLIARHYKTGKALPSEKISKLKAAKNFQIGLQILRQLEFGLFDMKLHFEYQPTKKNQAQKILNQVRKKVTLLPVAKFNRMQNSFEHIFAGGYAAGYYSYKWSEMLAANAFTKFAAKGILDKATGRQFLHSILEVGSSKDPMIAFKNFLGKEPDENQLLVINGEL